jgi:nucleoside-diphosphate-sugar epimerase
MRHVITGGSGYIGSRLVDLLSRRDDTERIVICDIAPPRGLQAEVAVRAPRRARPRGRAHRARARPCRRARSPRVILNPSDDEHLMYDVNVNGTHNVLEAAGQGSVPSRRS